MNKAIRTIFMVEFFQLLRHPVSVFWSFLFPTVLLVSLSVFFSNGSKDEKQEILITPERYVQFAVRTLDTSKYITTEIPNKSVYAAYLHVLSGKLTLDIYAKNDEEITNDIYASLYRSYLNETSNQKIDVISHAKKGDEHADILLFILPGIIGVSLVSTSLFSIGTTLVSFREQSILKKFGTTPLKKWEYLLGHVLGRLFLTMIQSTWLIVLGYFFLDISPFHNPISIILSFLLGILAFSGIGLIIGATADKVETASAISNFLFFPMVFLSGAYFPIDDVPRLLAYFIKIIPLYHFVKMFRGIYIDKLSIIDFLVEASVLAAFLVISLIIAKSKFKWEEEV